jgi:8-amino-7-oxononanoate synthase
MALLDQQVSHDQSDQTATPKTSWVMQSAPGPETILNGKRYLYFAGTGYLGLQNHPDLIAAAQKACADYGVHSATSRNGFGTTPLTQEVERRAADFFGTEAALYLVSGYAGNFAIAATIAEDVDLVLIDESAHYCLRESVRCFDRLQLPPLVFRHRDTEHVEQLLKTHCEPGWKPIVMTDGLFATTGNLAPLSTYVKLLSRYDRAMLLVDDAHGVGAIGDHGRGSTEIAGIPPQEINAEVDPSRTAPSVFLSATLSKAFGGHGGVIPGSRKFLDRIRQSSGWLSGASAPASPVAAATAKGLEIVQPNPCIREQLARNVFRLRQALRGLGLPLEISPSPILGFSIGDAQRMESIHQQLLDRQIAVAYSRNYAGSGPHGTLRIAVFATHTIDMIDQLVDALREIIAGDLA